MKRLSRFYAPAIAALVCLGVADATAFGQEAPKLPNSTGASAADELALSQSLLSDKYARLEELMFKMSTLEAASNPRRAALLTRAISQSKEKLTKTQFDALVKMLNQQQLKRAIDGQTAVQGDLKSLLDLLLSEDRSDRLKSEQSRIKEYLKEVEKLIRLQKGLEGQNSPSGDVDRLAKQQQELAERTGKLAQTIKQNEEGSQSDAPTSDGDANLDEESPSNEGKSKSGDGGESPNEAPPGDSQSGEPMPSSKPDSEPAPKPMDESAEPNDIANPTEGDNGDKNGATPSAETKEPMSGEPGSAEPSEGQSQPMPPSDGSSSPMPPADGQPQEGQQQPGQPQSGQPQSGQPQSGQPQQSEASGGAENKESQPANPARERIEEAQKRMQQAQKQLEEAKRKESGEEQRAAREELEKAKAELEEILRQMREEEVKRTLAALEERFKKMLEMQLKVYESTRRLDQLPEANRTDQFIVDSGKLSFDERKIATEAFKALTLLQEEGSSVAFPASVEQMHDDMQQVTDRLADAKVDDITVGIEEDVIASLEEMIEALQQAQQDLEEKEQQQQQQQQQQGEQKQSLVDQIAELKMIKALQLRVNKRTSRYARLLEDEQDLIGQASAAELVEALQKLSLRQQDIFRITRDIVIGKNK